jgi:MerR family transcriptional regulator/heat shock protein HspR
MANRDFERGVYVISVAAELAGVHPQTLRIYERRGLLDPARTGGGSRRYSQRDIDRLRRIHELTEAGLNLAGVKAVMELEEENARLRRQLNDVVAEAREAVDRVHRQYRRELVPVKQTPAPYTRPRR